MTCKRCKGWGIGNVVDYRIDPCPECMSREFHLAQLRHAYSHLMAERVRNQREFADGLIAPVIRYLETKEAPAK